MLPVFFAMLPVVFAMLPVFFAMLRVFFAMPPVFFAMLPVFFAMPSIVFAMLPVFVCHAARFLCHAYDEYLSILTQLGSCWDTNLLCSSITTAFLYILRQLGIKQRRGRGRKAIPFWTALVSCKTRRSLLWWRRSLSRCALRRGLSMFSDWAFDWAPAAPQGHSNIIIVDF